MRALLLKSGGRAALATTSSSRAASRALALRSAAAGLSVLRAAPAVAPLQQHQFTQLAGLSSSVISSRAAATGAFQQSPQAASFTTAGHLRPTEAGVAAIFQPKSVAVVGATDRQGSVGRTIVANLKDCSEGKVKIYPVNPSRDTVLGLQCYKSVRDLPEAVDLVVMVTPAKHCIDVMKQCTEKGIQSAVVISAGFKEAGSSGAAMEKELIDIARKGNIRVIGPNCLGVMSPHYNLNASFAATSAPPGSLAFISQSGAMCTAVLDWSLSAGLGFSIFASIGSMADVSWGDLLRYLENDPNTKSILIYMETIGDAEAFMHAAQSIGVQKPIIVIKSGKSEAAAKAAASHTGSLAGSYASFEAAMARVGAMTVDTIGELFNVAYFLGMQPRPAGPNLVIVTNAGGPAVLATDAAVGSGATMTSLSASCVEKLNAFLPSAWSHDNPVDILGDASAELYAKTLEVVLDDPHADGVLVVLSPQDVTDPTGTAKALVEATEKLRRAGKLQKPIFASWMGGASVAEGAALLGKAGIPAFANADDAASTFGRLWKQRAAAADLATAPMAGSTISSTNGAAVAEAKKTIAVATKEGRKLLTEAESKKVLEAFGVNCVPTRVATTVSEATAASKELGKKYDNFAVKLNSKTLTHKADVGGVKLNVSSADVPKMFEEIRKSVTEMHGAEHFQGVTVQPMIKLDKGLELILGSTKDPQFGPLVLFGAGGTFVEVFKDTALGVPPLDKEGARRLMEQTKIFKALKGGHGKRFEGVDLDQLAEILSKFSEMVVELKHEVAECDINPLLATKDGCVALDARVALT